MSATFGNSFIGLWQGSVDSNASSVINAILNDSILLVGDVVRLLGPLEGLLPTVAAGDNPSAFGVAVAGDQDGIYGEGREPADEAIDPNEFGTLAALRGDTVRVCTQGRCLAKVVNQTTSQLEVGTPLTGLRDAGNNIFAAFGVLVAGSEVLARLLQPVDAGISPSEPATRIAAVDIQREGIAP